MTRKGYIILFVVIVIVIAGLLYAAFRTPKDKKKNKQGEMCPDGKTPIPANGQCPKSSTTNPVPNPTGCVSPASYIDFKYPIKLGMKDGGNVYENKQVSVLQKQLNAVYKSGLKEDGFFGCNTEDVVKEKLAVTEVYYTNPIWTAKPILG